MRLVDVDALKAKIRDTAAEGTIADYCKRVMVECLDNDAPTIPAIPVEWLKGLMLSTEDDVDKVEFAWIMREWESEQKEQEAQDE